VIWTRVASISADWVITLAIVLAAVGGSVPFFEAEFNPYDGGLAVYGAERVADGLVPYVDGYTSYGPAQYYLRAGLFRLFGFNMGVFQREVVATAAIFVGVAYHVLRQCAGRGTSVVLAATAAMPLSILLPLGGYNFAAYVCFLIGAGGLMRYAQTRAWPWLVITGGATGLCFAEQWVFGLLGLLVFASAAVAMPYLIRIFEPEATIGTAPRVHGNRLATLLIPAVLVLLPFYAPAILEDPGTIARSVRLHLAVREARVLPYPIPPNPVGVVAGERTIGEYFAAAAVVAPAYAFPVLGLLNAAAVVVATRRRNVLKPPGALVLHTCVMTLLGGLLFEYGRSRADIWHTPPSAVFMILSLPLVVHLVRRPQRTDASVPTPLRLAGALVALAILAPVIYLSASRIRAESAESAPTGVLMSPRLSGVETDPGTAAIYNALIAYVRDHTAVDEPIFSGSVEHDRLFLIDVLVYFATDRDAGVWDYLMDPGSTTTAPVQRRIVTDLRRNHVRLVVLVDSPIPPEERHQESSGVTILDDYINANYAVVERFGPYVVLLPRAEVQDSSDSSALSNGSLEGMAFSVASASSARSGWPGRRRSAPPSTATRGRLRTPPAPRRHSHLGQA